MPITKINIQDTLNSAADFVDAVLGDNYVPTGYSLEDMTTLFEMLGESWRQIEDYED